MQARPSLGDVVSTAGLVLGLITAWLYAAGWNYAYVYFDRFHIPLLMLTIPFEHMLVYGGLVLWKNIWFASLCGAVIIAILWVLARWAALFGRFIITTLVVLMGIVAFALAHIAGDAAAWSDFELQRASDYDAFPRVELKWEGTGAPLDQAFADVLKTDCGRLFAVSNDHLFLIRPVQGAVGLALETFIIANNKIEAMRVRADYTSCR